MTLIGETQKWLESQGFPLEMRTAAEFKKAGFYVHQAGLYVDPETQKNREIDVEAIVANFEGLVQVRFIVECKTTTKPWVLLCSEDNSITGYARHDVFSAMSKLAHKSLYDRRRDWDRIAKKVPWLYKEFDLVGYALKQTHSDKDTGYAAAMSVAKACAARVNEGRALNEDRPQQVGFGFPVIVTTAPLVKCWLQDDGHLQLKEVNQGEFLFLEGGFTFCIRVVTAPHLPAFALEAKSIADELRKEFRPEAEQWLEEYGAKFHEF